MKALVASLILLLSQYTVNDEDPGESSVNYSKGLIINLGENTDNGCGWVVEVDGTKYKPRNLSKAFQKDSLKVNVDYERSLTLFKCDQAKKGLQEININWMEKSD